MLRVMNHPLCHHYVAKLRDRNTPPDSFRTLAKRVTTLLIMSACDTLRTEWTDVATPMEIAPCQMLSEKVVAVPILRAGLGMLDPVLELIPDVAVGYIGLERNEETAMAFSYYAKLPRGLAEASVFVLDPMLATGGSASFALEQVAAAGAKRITMISIVAAPEGIERVTQDHPGVDLVVAALDRGLDCQSYILPGLGDFGDRLYGTVPSADG